MPVEYSNNINELLSKVAAGDEHSFAQLFRIYHNELAGFILQITQSEALAQEIVQDVFLKIWINRNSLKDIHCFKAYLSVAARNHAFNCLKQIARENSNKKEWVNTILRKAANNEEETGDRQFGELLDEAVELLPPQQKKVYLLSRMESMKHEEIAGKLGISLETVKKHMVLALKFLKNHLRKHISFLSLLVIYCCPK